MTLSNLPATTQKRLDRTAKKLWDLHGSEIEIWKKRGKYLLDEYEKIGDKSFREWCAENYNFGISLSNCKKQRLAVELLENLGPQAESLSEDYTLLADLSSKCRPHKKGPLDTKMLETIIKEKPEILNDDGKVTRSTYKKAFPPSTNPLTKIKVKGPAKTVWKPDDYKFLRQVCHPDRHPGKEKKFERVMDLLKRAYEG